MGENRFLKLLKEFDDNYFVEESKKKYSKDEAIINNQTLKQYLSSDPTTPLQWYSQIDYQTIERIIKHADINPFESFYTLEETTLNEFFYVLHTVDLLLKYVQNDMISNSGARKRLSNKYTDVIYDLEYFSVPQKLMDTLIRREQSLRNQTTLTERKIFEYLHYNICNFLQRDSKIFKSTTRLANITNKLISEYFQPLHIPKFSKNASVDGYIKHYYYFETKKPIILFHS